MRGLAWKTWGDSTGVDLEEGLRYFLDVRLSDVLNPVPYSSDILVANVLLG